MSKITNFDLQIENVYKHFPGVQALDNVSFFLKKQSVHALLGQNGAGKSTLINVLMGSFPMDSGKIRIDNQEVEIKSTADALSLGLACIYQEMFTIPDVSVAENIFLGDIPSKKPLNNVDFNYMYSRAEQILEEMGVDLNVKRKTRGLGVAEQQLIMIARALQRKSRILVMDEPTASLDKSEIQKLFRIIRKLTQNGHSIIYISHYLDEIFEIADEVTILRNGKNVKTGNINELDESNIIEYMLGYNQANKNFSSNENVGKVVLEVENLNNGPRVQDICFLVKKRGNCRHRRAARIWKNGIGKNNIRGRQEKKRHRENSW